VVELDFLARGEHHLDAAACVQAELLLAGEKIGRRLQQLLGLRGNSGWLSQNWLRQCHGQQQCQ